MQMSPTMTPMRSIGLDGPSDFDTLPDLAAGDPMALASLRRFLFRSMLAKLSGKADASAVEDFVQEAVLKILAKLDSFRGEGEFGSWALSIGMRVAFSELRKARWKDVSLDGFSAAGRFLFEPAIHDPDPVDVIHKEMVLTALRRLVETSLTDRQRVAIRAELNGVPASVTAERLGINRNSLYKLGHDARMKLKQGLLDSGFSI